MRRQNELKLSEVIKLMIAELKLEEQLLNTQAAELWHQQMGKVVSSYTMDVCVKNRVMTAKIKSPELRNELSYGKSKIIQHINQQLGKDFIQDLRLL